MGVGFSALGHPAPQRTFFRLGLMPHFSLALHCPSLTRLCSVLGLSTGVRAAEVLTSSSFLPSPPPLENLAKERRFTSTYEAVVACLGSTSYLRAFSTAAVDRRDCSIHCLPHVPSAVFLLGSLVCSPWSSAGPHGRHLKMVCS